MIRESVNQLHHQKIGEDVSTKKEKPKLPNRVARVWIHAPDPMKNSRKYKEWCISKKMMNGSKRAVPPDGLQNMSVVRSMMKKL